MHYTNLCNKGVSFIILLLLRCRVSLIIHRFVICVHDTPIVSKNWCLTFIPKLSNAFKTARGFSQPRRSITRSLGAFSPLYVPNTWMILMAHESTQFRLVFPIQKGKSKYLTFEPNSSVSICKNYGDHQPNVKTSNQIPLNCIGMNAFARAAVIS